MKQVTQERLLALNRDFYATVAEPFDATRAGLPIGWQGLPQWLPFPAPSQPLRVLDIGCGNGRWARCLETWGVSTLYTGVDTDRQLLQLAADNTRSLTHIQTNFLTADFTKPGWADALGLTPAAFDCVVCFAALHHVPGYQLRQKVVAGLAALLAPKGALIFSHWQFLQSERFVRKQITWQTIGLTEDEIEAGDALLPWRQGSYAVRYVHQITEVEMLALAAAAGLQVATTFYADGKEGNLNLYAVLRAT